jgi:hypothetical protein
MPLSPPGSPPTPQINAAITDRDYLRADKVQNDLANLGDQRYVQRNIRFGSGAGGSIQEPLLGSGWSVSCATELPGPAAGPAPAPPWVDSSPDIGSASGGAVTCC